MLFSSTAFAQIPIYINDAESEMDQNIQVLDANDSGGDIAVQFGTTLNEKLLWDADGGDGTGIFQLTDDTYIEGKLGINIAIPLSFLHLYEDTTSVDATAGMTIENDGTGDSILQFLLSGAQRWVVGIDNSDSDKFKIASSTDLNTDTHFEIDTSGTTTFYGNIAARTNGATGTLRLLELAANGSNYAGFKAPDSLASDLTWTLPSSDGSNGQQLTTNGAGTLSWSDGKAKKLILQAKTGLHQADGGSNNCDSWTYYDYTDLEQYNSVSANLDNQGIDIIYHGILPPDFNSWDTSAMLITYKTSSASTATSAMNCTVYDTLNTSAHSTGNLASTSVTNATITATNLTDGAETWNAGSDFIVICKASTDTGASTSIGKIVLSYN